MTDALLVVEDSKVFALMLKKLIEDAHGYEVDWAASYAELAKKITGSQKYFAAIVDRHLPDAPNGEAIDLVATTGIPSIVFTGTADGAEEEDLWEKNIADYANKSSSYGVEHVVWQVKRLHDNLGVEILVVDDSVVARKTMARLLKTQRFTVHIAESGHDALKLLKQYPNIRVAIIDCNMEVMDGYQLVSLIRESHEKNDLEIIGVSSSSNQSRSARFIKAGANDFLSKPFIPEEFLCRVNNVVNRAEAYRQLKKVNQQKNRFLSMAAHDIRGPLGAIYNAAVYLRKKSWSPERMDTLLKMIEDNSSDMQTLLNDLLDVTNIESGVLKLNLETVNLCEILDSRLNIFGAEAEAKGIQIKTQMDCGLKPDIQGDRIKLQQVIDNVLINAIKFTPAKGSIDIDLDYSDTAFTLKVKDSGPGIPKEELPNLFKPFQVLSTRSTGGEKQTGLGLTIAKNIVDAHGGKIEYVSSDNGATFVIELPKSRPTEQA